jgi:FKBP-type peptidyl-prolyl cis-trans isomerase FkpA
MSKLFFKYAFFTVLAITIISCNKDSASNTVPLRDFNEQYLADIDSIDNFIDTHYMTVDANYNVTFDLIPTGGTQLSIRQQTDYPLEYRMYTNEDQEVDYKIYYIKLREGNGQNPSAVDSVHVAYRGVLAKSTAAQFDYSQNPVWFKMDELISGWSKIMPMFKTGTYDTTQGPNPTTFDGYGAGVMFIPSGLAYYNNPPSLGIPVYTSLIFTFKLYELQYRDHDRDGILSKDEVPYGSDILYDPRKYDSDGDGVYNLYDIDDDGDHVLTKNEIKDPISGLPYPFADIPSCSGDVTTPDRLKKHLDTQCH